MKIGIDGYPLTIPFPCGSKTYAAQLINGIAKIDKKNQYYIFSKKTVRLPKQKNFKLVKIPNLLPIFKRQLVFPYLVKKLQLDLFHFLEPYGIIIKIHPKIITTVHDYNLEYTYPFGRFPFERINTEFFRFFTFRNSKTFITPTDTIKKEFYRSTHISNVYTIPEGVSGNFRVLGTIKKPPQKFLLAMGDFAPRKNIPNVLKAYKRLPAKIKKQYKLIIVASTISSKEIFLKIIHEQNLRKNVKVLHNVSTLKLVELYNTASCFLYPSLYEGFGIPILEAMECGCPVITSNRGAVKEVAGDAAIFINPKSPLQISEAIKKLLANKRLSRSLKLKGLGRVKKFSWQKTAKKTLEIYEKVHMSPQ